MNDRGRHAEALAARYLERRGLRIVARNWRCRRGEIDLIARDGPVLVFVEVRQRASRSHGGAAESITLAKRGKLVAAANHYLARAGMESPCRFDAILVDGQEHLEWVRDAFGAS
ncbi:MAG: YraN family protein [Burkholderiales bacterium]|nr:YraN family protein [Burkholderiales bacterium]